MTFRKFSFCRSKIFWYEQNTFRAGVRIYRT